MLKILVIFLIINFVINNEIISIQSTIINNNETEVIPENNYSSEIIYKEIQIDKDYLYGEDYVVENNFTDDFDYKMYDNYKINTTINGELTEEFIKIFDLKFPTKKMEQNITTPQFISDLYQTISNDYIDSNINDFYNSNIIISLPEQDPDVPGLFKFDLTGLNDYEILEAELHVYRIGQRLPVYDSPYYLLRVYQLLNDEKQRKNILNLDLNQLLNVHYVSSFTTGWQVFKIKRAVDEWLENPEKNYGIFISAVTVLNEPVDINFSRKNIYNLKYQPTLIIFANNKNKNNQIINKKLKTTSNLQQNEITLQENCYKQPLFINFTKLGLKNNIIISPDGYEAFKCSGNCEFPFEAQSATNYALFLSISNYFNSTNDNKICCVAEKMKSLPILYKDGENFVLKQFENMIIDECGCR